MRSCLLLFLFISAGTELFAQVQITKADVESVFEPGKSWIDFSKDNPMTNMNVGSASSSAQSWTTPNIEWGDTSVATNVTPASTPYQAEFPNATHAQYGTGYIEGHQASQYTYYRIEDDGIYELGTALEANIGGIDTVIIQSGGSELIFPLPLTYGLVLDDSRDSMDVGGGAYTITVKSTSVDAFGTVTFPFGSFQALRVSDIEETTIYLNGTPINHSASSSFNWIATDGGTFEADIDTGSGTSGEVTLNYASMTQFNYIPTSAKEDLSMLPSSFQLYQNYPNPFNPTTNIKYAVPQTGFVSLKVYDVLGNEAANLVNEIKAPGAYTVKFDASQLSSGVYFYRLQTAGSNISLTKKLILIK